MKKVLIACERSGILRNAFTKAGFDAYSIDLEDSDKPSSKHIKEDVLKYINKPWDLIIAHPPCQYLSNSGVWALHKDPSRWAKMKLGAMFFRRFLYANANHICVENPVMHSYAKDIIGFDQTQTIQPWQFGEDASKRTCLWLINLPKLVPTKIILKKRYANQTPSGQNKLGPGKNRAYERSKTYPGIARAMVSQWKKHI